MLLQKKAAPLATKKVKQAKPLPFEKEWARINYYFEMLDEQGPAEDLWEMLKLALIADNDLVTPRERSNMIFLYEYTKQLIATYIPCYRRRTKKRKHHNKQIYHGNI